MTGDGAGVGVASLMTRIAPLLDDVKEDIKGGEEEEEETNASDVEWFASLGRKGGDVSVGRLFLRVVLLNRPPALLLPVAAGVAVAGVTGVLGGACHRN